MNVLSDAKAKGVELAGVNVMTMDYGNAILSVCKHRRPEHPRQVQRL